MLNDQDLSVRWLGLLVSLPKQFPDTVKHKIVWLKTNLNFALALILLGAVQILIRLYGDSEAPEIDLAEIIGNS